MRIAIALLALGTLAACGVNPVTGKKEIQFVSEAQELKIGEQNYAPTRQSEGGDFDVLPELTAYVNEVGQKLAAVADRKLPYEFVVLNSSVPNAWALPGGKIAVNRGLLTELQSESELAAVLGHEIVHAAARHGAKAQERGTLLQVGLAAAQIGAAVGGVDTNVAGLLIQGAGVGAQLVQQKYGREQELEADQYGMKYMKLAGYDPWGAVTLQETFVRLSQQEGAKQQGWLEGLFASHPPSTERVEKNKRAAEELGRGGEVGEDRYAARMKPLRAVKPAYDKYDQALVARAQEGLRRRTHARRGGDANAAEGRALPAAARRDRAGGEAAEGSTALLPEGDRAELRITSARTSARAWRSTRPATRHRPRNGWRRARSCCPLRRPPTTSAPSRASAAIVRRRWSTTARRQARRAASARRPRRSSCAWICRRIPATTSPPPVSSTRKADCWSSCRIARPWRCGTFASRRCSSTPRVASCSRVRR